MDEERELESEDEPSSNEVALVPKTVIVTEDGMKESIKESLLRLARVLKRFAKKGEGTVGTTESPPVDGNFSMEVNVET